MAITAAFDLEIVQLDAINAFLNSPINEESYTHYPEGYKKPGQVLRLLRALYGLRTVAAALVQGPYGGTPIASASDSAQCQLPTIK